MNWPRITVVTCSYNQAAFIEETIKSVISQGYPNLEYIIIDGGSNDGSVEIIKKYEKHLTAWVSEKDNGQTDALRKGFAMGTGEIFCWLCSDDLFERNCLKEVAELFVAHPEMEFVYGDTYFIDKAGKLFRKYKTFPFNAWLWLDTWNYLPQPSAFWRRGLYERVGGMNCTERVFGDSDLFWRFSRVTKLHHFKRYWSSMRQYPETISASRNDEGVSAHSRRAENYFGHRSKLRVRASHVAARVTRIAVKSLYGCFWAI